MKSTVQVLLVLSTLLIFSVIRTCSATNLQANLTSHYQDNTLTLRCSYNGSNPVQGIQWRRNHTFFKYFDLEDKTDSIQTTQIYILNHKGISTFNKTPTGQYQELKIFGLDITLHGCYKCEVYATKKDGYLESASAEVCLKKGVEGESLMVCSQKEFHAECPDQEYIFIDSAWYGKCVKGVEKECGCDATPILGDLCNGRTNCTTEVLDKQFPCENTCSKDYKRHLYVNYGCATNSNTWIIIIVGVISGIGFILLVIVCCRFRQPIQALYSDDLQDVIVKKPLMKTLSGEKTEAENNPTNMVTPTADNNNKDDAIPSRVIYFEINIMHRCNGNNYCFEINRTSATMKIVPHSQPNTKHTDENQTTLAPDDKSESQTTNSNQTEETSAPSKDVSQQDSKPDEKSVCENTEGTSESRQHSQSTVSTATDSSQNGAPSAPAKELIQQDSTPEEKCTLEGTSETPAKDVNHQDSKPEEKCVCEDTEGTSESRQHGQSTVCTAINSSQTGKPSAPAKELTQ